MTVGEMTLAEAWQTLTSEPEAILIDVRTLAEWNFVGVPEISDTGCELRFVEWITFPHGAPNPQFVAEAGRELQADQPILLLCRSGARSLAAAAALEAAGFTNTHNVVAGFEGDPDGNGHRHGGWKDELPWTQQ